MLFALYSGIINKEVVTSSVLEVNPACSGMPSVDVLLNNIIRTISGLLIFRDLHDIGCYAKVIDGCQQLDKETR